MLIVTQGQSIVTDNILRTFNLYGTNGQYQYGSRKLCDLHSTDALNRILLTDSNLAVSLSNGASGSAVNVLST